LNVTDQVQNNTV